ncbi:2-hydroxyacid dehydrogenase [Halobacillus karajensis]|uniref:Glyoxylate/hydroxypyruvate reductase B n=1 Tax=Halobacillus karajensis TaxID=195088 RepID=A0A024P4T8_9BACI|nr:D-glycerate dehydrogenase [Halobacillus karajensis]CDQ19085.1 Glyoxylate/hydroxypyruvate reductase B [Halobacillus karajensis]CDQ22841.1 Glyoxylate/hydroxypyruvate reductase B [Halobacillus karajensis]CDQ26323.1 Glyoxylate/hydroxypyruvate reductase B [Halobacillus karajensis]
MKPKVFIAKPISRQVENYIAEHCEYKIWREEERIPDDILFREIQDVQGLMIPKAKVTESFIKQAPNLKIISHISVGYDTLDTDLMAKHKIIGTHTPYVLDHTVADLIFGLILSSSRRISQLDHYVKDGKWNKLDDPSFLSKDVHHATLGIIGMGRIGEQVAKRAAQGFDMNVLYYNRRPRPEVEEKYGLKRESMEQLLKKSDFVLTMVPLTEETHHLIGARELKQMKEDALLINASRGQVVDEKALIHALKEGIIGGAGLDVFEKEPVDPSNSLLKMDNVVTTPHIGSATAQAREAMALKAAENLVAGVTGGKPKNIVKELKHLG